MGYTFNAGPECEFFLFHTDETGRPTTLTHDMGGYFDLSPMDLGEDARRDICLTLEDMGFDVQASHHEDATVARIDFRYDEALRAADNFMTFKIIVKCAKRHNLHATFMPKPSRVWRGVVCISTCPFQETVKTFSGTARMSEDYPGRHIVSWQVL